jgi:hypothetical protein
MKEKNSAQSALTAKKDKLKIPKSLVIRRGMTVSADGERIGRKI